MLRSRSRSVSTILLVALALVAPGASASSTVELSGDRWKGLLAPEEDREEDPPGPWVAEREVTLTPTDEALQVRVRWRVRTVDPRRWVFLRLADASVRVERVTWNGRPASATATEQGTVVVGRVQGTTTIELVGSVLGDVAERPMSLSLEPATVGTVRILGPRADRTGVGSLEREVTWLGPGRLGTGARALRVEQVSRRAARRDATIAIAHAAVGMTVGDAEVRTQARIRWEVARGELGDTVTATLRGAGPDLEVTGPLVASWTRSGDQVVVKLRRPDARLIQLEASWSQATPRGETAKLTVPQVVPAQAFRTETAFQLARDGEVEMIPTSSGLEAVPASGLPDWADGLVQGTPTAAFVGSGRGELSVDLLRFEPVEGPATLVDVASYTIAATEEGRVLVRGHFAVRNDRGAFLRVTPPPGLSIVGARVSGETAEVGADGSAWLVPLDKSVETVEGLLSFPVEVVLLGELGGAWSRKEERTLPLPTVDAEVAVSRVTLHLPPGYTSLVEPGEERTVASFTEGQGITYGFGTGDVRAAAADQRFQEAVNAWMDNRFDDAQGYLDELEMLGADSANIERLQSNLDVVMGGDSDKKSGGDGEVALSRRVKEQAQARAAEDVAKQRELLEEAEKKELKGDYAGAEQEYRQALEVGEMLDQIAQDEDVQYKAGNVAISEKLKDVSKRKNEVAEAEAERQARLAAEEERRRAEEVSRGSVITEEFLESVPAGRSYQQAVQMQAGVTGQGGNANMAGAASNSNAVSEEPVEGGVVGGEVSSEIGGLDDAEPMPDAGVEMLAVESRSGPSIRLPKVSMGKKKKPEAEPSAAAPPPPPAQPTPAEPELAEVVQQHIEISMGQDEDKPLDVSAAAMSVVVPTRGEAVRYQRLLLPAEAPLEVTVRAKQPRRSR